MRSPRVQERYPRPRFVAIRFIDRSTTVRDSARDSSLLTLRAVISDTRYAEQRISKLPALSPPDDSTGRRGGLVVGRPATGRLNIGGADVD